MLLPIQLPGVYLFSVSHPQEGAGKEKDAGCRVLEFLHPGM